MAGRYVALHHVIEERPHRWHPARHDSFVEEDGCKPGALRLTAGGYRRHRADDILKPRPLTYGDRDLVGGREVHGHFLVIASGVPPPEIGRGQDGPGCIPIRGIATDLPEGEEEGGYEDVVYRGSVPVSE